MMGSPLYSLSRSQIARQIVFTDWREGDYQNKLPRPQIPRPPPPPLPNSRLPRSRFRAEIKLKCRPSDELTAAETKVGEKLFWAPVEISCQMLADRNCRLVDPPSVAAPAPGGWNGSIQPTKQNKGGGSVLSPP